MKQLLLIFCFLVYGKVHAQSNYWTSINSGTHKRLLSVSFGSTAVGYISGEDSLLLKTTDGGKTWSPLAFSGIGFSIARKDLTHINFVSPVVGYAIAGNFSFPLYNGVLHKTVDGGVNWSPVTAGNIAAGRTYFFDELNGYLIGSAFFAGQTVIKLQSGTWGTEWNFTSDPAQFLYGIDFLTNDIGIVGGTGGYVYRTLNGGQTWDTVKTVVDSTINSIKFVDANTVLAATDNFMGSIIISTDTGRTWQVDGNTQTFLYPSLKALALSAKDSFVAVGQALVGVQGIKGAVLSWHNGFANVVTVGQPLWDVTMSNDSVAFAVGDSGLIISNLMQLVSINPPSPETGYYRVYPSPSTGRFSSEMHVKHRVEVYSISGSLVYSNHQNQQLHQIDLSAFPKGIYLLKMLPENSPPVFERALID